MRTTSPWARVTANRGNHAEALAEVMETGGTKAVNRQPSIVNRKDLAVVETDGRSTDS